MKIKSKAATSDYRDGWDRIFGKKAAPDLTAEEAKEMLESHQRAVCDHEFESGLSHNDVVYVCKKCGRVDY